MNTKPMVTVRLQGGFYHDSGEIAIDAEGAGFPPLELVGGPDTYSRGPIDGRGVWTYTLVGEAAPTNMVPKPRNHSAKTFPEL